MTPTLIQFSEDGCEYITIEVVVCENPPYDFMDHLDQWLDAYETQQSFKELMDSFVDDGCILSHRKIETVHTYNNELRFDMDDYKDNITNLK